jgi:hypothetical protein
METYFFVISYLPWTYCFKLPQIKQFSSQTFRTMHIPTPCYPHYMRTSSPSKVKVIYGPWLKCCVPTRLKFLKLLTIKQFSLHVPALIQGQDPISRSMTYFLKALPTYHTRSFSKDYANHILWEPGAFMFYQHI